MGPLSHRLDRSVIIHASPETVFRFFTDSDRWAKWWGKGSTIDARVGGRVYIQHPGGVETIGEVLEVDPPSRLVFTYGFASGKPIPPGSSRVTIRLESSNSATRLHLQHEFDNEVVRDEHVQGWRFQLSLFGNAVADEVHAGAAAAADAWFAAWAIPDETERAKEFARIGVAGVTFRDRFSLLEGLEDLTAHAGASQRFMPGVRLHRKGDILHCQGRVLADWIATGTDGTERWSGTNLFEFGTDARIVSVTGFAKL
jgi:uncharacterized protein YndB with AHSA1/START domain